jgi:NADH-quinone oxidoreductase subunit J
MLAPALANVVFYLTVAVSLWLAWSVVSSRRNLRAAVSLMGVLGASAALYLLLGFPFLAGVQVLVYVGGIVVLLVFAVMLTRSQELLEDHPSDLRHKIGVVAAGAFFATHLWVLRSMPPLPQPRRSLPASDTEMIGQALLGTGADGYALPFEVISLLLLTAMVGGIVIARKTGSPQQDAALADAALANSALANSALAISAVANPDGAAASTVTGQSNSTEATHG